MNFVIKLLHCVRVWEAPTFSIDAHLKHMFEYRLIFPYLPIYHILANVVIILHMTSPQMQLTPCGRKVHNSVHAFKSYLSFRMSMLV